MDHEVDPFLPAPGEGSRRRADARGIPIIGAFETTLLPGYGIDVAETSQHCARWREDVDHDLQAGVRTFRYPLRWHRIEAERGSYDWREPDGVLGHLHDSGAVPIVDLLHHTSYPAWLTDGFRDAGFPDAYLRYAEAVASRYPWLSAHTLFNEPFATLFLAGHEALWPPYDHGLGGLSRLVNNVLPAISRASSCWSDLLPGARHVWVDTCEHHTGTPGGPAQHAAMANDRRHAILDLTLGRELDPSRPFLGPLIAEGIEATLGMQPIRVDVLGLDYYPHSEWWYDETGGHAPSPHPLGFAALATHYAARYAMPLMLTETNIRGLPTDRISWLRYMVEQYEIALDHGVPLEGFCWFPSVDSSDWDSLLARPAGRSDPVGVRGIGLDGNRTAHRFTDAWRSVVEGARAAGLTAYHFQPPCEGQLTGFIDRLRHWPWTEPPVGETPAPLVIPAQNRNAMLSRSANTTRNHDLVVLSHLRWTWVWQRPQHLVSRFADHRSKEGARTYFVEEPVVADVEAPELCAEERDGVTRVWLAVPAQEGRSDAVGFDSPAARDYAPLLARLLSELGTREVDVLLYTPMALEIAQRLEPSRLHYDVMDDLASFLGAPEGLRLLQRRTLTEADVVFAGGRSLHQSVSQHRNGPVHLFPSGVETAHFAASRALREKHSRPVAGYVGVIDERLDLSLLAGLAERLSDWTIRVVGPVAKIDPKSLPRARNLEYPGMAAHEELPAVMAGFDVALMPFALNQATRSISPTKTLEYLAAGLPVVSTRVPDVVADFPGLVHLADTDQGFARTCRHVLHHPTGGRDPLLHSVLTRHEWDHIASVMQALMAGTASSFEPVEAQA